MKNALHEDAIRSLEAYIERYPSEEEIKTLLVEVRLNDLLVKRENLSGHLTASGLVLHEDKLLLIFHKKLQRYLQPGGHLEDDLSLIEAAQREVLEETGLQVIPFLTSVDEAVMPLYVDIQTIPYNEKKDEPEHYHYDCMFLLTTANPDVHLQKSEVEDFKWVSLEHAFEDRGIVEAIKKIKALAR